MWFLLVAAASATCLNLTVSPSECVDGERVRVTVDCDGGPVPPRWDVELQQDGGDYGRLVDLGELVGGVAEGTCVDPGLPCDGGQTSYLYAVATDEEGRQEWAFTRLLVKAQACEASEGTREPEGLDAPAAEGLDEEPAPRAAETEDEERGGCGAGACGLAGAGLLVFGLRGRRRR